ncbi:MAG: sigma-70 family RNA polymerase sigma factor [Anaerolineae bacterium]|nr:sigma-70 family RNA polymerase sigma factor [Anaerolineae bacterium]
MVAVRNTMTPEQAKLITLAKQGDSQAISQLYRAHAQAIYRYIAYRVPTSADAEDITSDVFMRMLEGLSSYEIMSVPFEAWLYRIATHRIADFFRKRSRQKTHIELHETLANDDPMPEESIQKQQEFKNLRTALGYLSQEQQDVLILRFIENKSHEDVANILEKSQSAVRTIQHRALVRLSQLLGADEKAKHYLRGDAHD